MLIWWICPFTCLVSVKGQHLHECLCFFYVYSSVIIPLTQLPEQIVWTRSQLQPCALHIYIPNIGYLPDIRYKSHVVSKISNFNAPWHSTNSIYIYVSLLLYFNAIFAHSVSWNINVMGHQRRNFHSEVHFDSALVQIMVCCRPGD